MRGGAVSWGWTARGRGFLVHEGTGMLLMSFGCLSCSSATAPLERRLAPSPPLPAPDLILNPRDSSGNALTPRAQKPRCSSLPATFSTPVAGSDNTLALSAPPLLVLNCGPPFPPFPSRRCNVWLKLYEHCCISRSPLRNRPSDDATSELAQRLWHNNVTFALTRPLFTMQRGSSSHWHIPPKHASVQGRNSTLHPNSNPRRRPAALDRPAALSRGYVPRSFSADVWRFTELRAVSELQQQVTIAAVGNMKRVFLIRESECTARSTRSCVANKHLID